MSVDATKGQDAVDRTGGAQQVQPATTEGDQPEVAPHDHAARAQERGRVFTSHQMGETAMRARLEGYMAEAPASQPAAEATAPEPGLFDRARGWAREQADGATAAAGRVRDGASAIAHQVSDGVRGSLREAADGAEAAAWA